jgi:hypothetical protein
MFSYLNPFSYFTSPNEQRGMEDILVNVTLIKEEFQQIKQKIIEFFE